MDYYSDSKLAVLEMFILLKLFTSVSCDTCLLDKNAQL